MHFENLHLLLNWELGNFFLNEHHITKLNTCHSYNVGGLGQGYNNFYSFDPSFENLKILSPWEFTLHKRTLNPRDKGRDKPSSKTPSLGTGPHPRALPNTAFKP
jgi:hypothetical protein